MEEDSEDNLKFKASLYELLVSRISKVIEQGILSTQILTFPDNWKFEIKTMKVYWHESECFMHILNDITEMHQAHIEKSWSYFQRMMMSNVSHEYRTPLNAIISSAELNLMHVNDLLKEVG